MHLEELRARREDILAIAERYGAANVRVFGSVARGDARPDSDIDLLVEYTQPISLLDHIGFVQDLGECLERKVDISTPKTLHRIIRQHVLDEAIGL